MSKLLGTFLLLLTATSAMANEFTDLDSEACPNARIIKNTAYCDVEGADQVIKAKVGVMLQTFPSALKGKIRGAVELNLIPDDSTNGIYQYIKTLADGNGSLVGYLVLNGYTNSEMEARWKMATKYGLGGEIVSIYFSAF